MTGNELIYQIFEDFNIDSDDSNITEKYILQLINQQRALFLTNEGNKRGHTLDSKLIQTLKPSNIEKVSTVLSNDLGLTSECFFVRTTDKVPRAIETHKGQLYTRIGPLDLMAKEFPLKELIEINFAGNGRFNENVISAFWLDDRIYLASKSEDFQFVKAISIRGIFEDPIEAANYKLPASECWTLDDEYPLSDRLFNYIKAQILQQLAYKYSIPSDTTNDASDTIKQPAQAPQRQ